MISNYKFLTSKFFSRVVHLVCVCVEGGGGRVGGGGYPQNWDTLFNIGIIRCAKFGRRHKGKVSNLWNNWKRDDVKYYKLLQTPKARASRGLWGYAPPPPKKKNSNVKALKRHFQYSQVDSCVKKVPRIDCYFLLLKLWQKERCHQL